MEGYAWTHSAKILMLWYPEKMINWHMKSIIRITRWTHVGRERRKGHKPKYREREGIQAKIQKEIIQGTEERIQDRQGMERNTS